MTAVDDGRVVAIRADALVGRGTCSSVDECYTDAELVEMLDAEGVTGAAAAIRWACDYEALWVEQGTNTWSGEESDAVRAETEGRLRELREGAKR